MPASPIQVAGRPAAAWRAGPPAGPRWVRVPMLLASVPGSIGIAVPLRPVAELANPVNRPGTKMALGADQAQQPHEIVWACTDPLSNGRHRSGQHTPRPVGAGSDGVTGFAVRCQGILLPAARSPTSAGGLVPARRRAQTSTSSACVGGRAAAPVAVRPGWVARVGAQAATPPQLANRQGSLWMILALRWRREPSPRSSTTAAQERSERH
jgi:hypothetical protein